MRHGTVALFVVEPEASWDSESFDRLDFGFRLYPGPGILHLVVSVDVRWEFELRFGFTQLQKLVDMVILSYLSFVHYANNKLWQFVLPFVIVRTPILMYKS